MDDPSSGTATVKSTLLGFMALVLAVAAWGIPVRWHWIHPAALSAAGEGTPTLVQVGEAAAEAGRPGPAALIAAAAVRLGLTGTNQLLARIEAATASPAHRAVGGGDALLSRVPGLRLPEVTNGFGVAMGLFLPELNRTALRTVLSQSQLPATRAVLGARTFAPREFAPVDRPGGQPLDAVLLMLAALAESDALTPAWAAELQKMASASGAGVANEPLEQVCLDLLTLSRRLDWTSLRELVRTVPDSGAFHRWTATVRTNLVALPELYSAAVLSGAPGAVADRYSAVGGKGATGLRVALEGGVGATRAYASSRHPVASDGFVFRSLGRWVQGNPLLATVVRTGLFAVSAFLLALGLGGALGLGVGPHGGRAWTGTLALGLALGTFLFIVSELLPPRARTEPSLKIKLLAGSAITGGTSVSRERPVMDSITLGTIVVFALLQLTIYVICRRKINEILSLPEPALVRLRLMENEENLFDAGLYIGIAGTAAALVLQVLHLMEANLLAAYSSNLLGIVTVAMVKIGHVRPIKRELILEGQVDTGGLAGR